MKRIAAERRVLYLRRHIGWSIILFAGALGTVVFAALRPTPEKSELGVALYYGVSLAIAAFIALLRSDVFAIDRTQGKLMVISRQFLFPRRSVFDLSRVSVELIRGRSSKSTLWINVSGERSRHFKSDRRLELLRADAERLAADLGCPLAIRDFS